MVGVGNRTLGWLLAVGILAGCGSPQPPSILLIVADALRADAVECYGGAAATPNLCALAERGVLFERAFAAAPWTLPSATAMMTGRYPGQFRWRQQGAEPGPLYHVPDEERLLAERLRDRDFTVECLLENNLARRSNALQGFTVRTWDRDRSLGILRRFRDRLALGPATDGRYLKILWLVDSFFDPRRRPFFLLHWIDDPHAEYRPPKDLMADLREESAALPRPLAYYQGLGHHRRPDQGRRKLRTQASLLSREEIDFLERLYLREIESVDRRLGQILAALELSGRAADTIVVVTSDHGEAFGEHGRFLHGDSLYNELVRVPLVIAGPGVAPGRRVATAVSHVDLMPTLGELLAMPAADTQGRSLLPALTGGRLARRPVYLESPDRLDFDGLVAGGWKMIADRDGGSVELYDLDRDPGELDDLSREQGEVAQRLLALLDEVRRDHRLRRSARESAVAPEALDRASREIRQQMEALGYLD